MTLYEKHTSANGKITYKEHIEAPMRRIEFELDNAEVCTMVAGLGICCLHGFEAHLPEHAAISRKVRALEVAIGDVAALNYHDLTEKPLGVIARAWSAALTSMQDDLSKCEAI